MIFGPIQVRRPFLKRHESFVRTAISSCGSGKRLAELAGVSVNLEFPYLERGLWELVGIVGVARGVVPADAAGRPAVRESDAVVTRSRVAAVLMKQALVGDAGSPIVSYCLSGGGLSDQGFAVRLWQVAGRLADLFREYEFSRTTMVREWLAGRDLPGASDVALEQARIYRMVCGSDLSGEPCGVPPGMSLFELAETVFPQSQSAASNLTPTPLQIGPVYIFGMSSMSPYHCRIIYELCRFMDIRMYHLNACREFWRMHTHLARTAGVESGMQPATRLVNWCSPMSRTTTRC